jgi:hypothetical protein
MLDEFVIVGIVMVLTQLVKGPLRRALGAETTRKLTPLIVLILAGLLNVANAQVFGMGEIPSLPALAEGLKLGAIAGGIYSMGRAALGMQ